MTLTGQNLTDLFDLLLLDELGFLLKHDLDANEHVVLSFIDLDFLTDPHSSTFWLFLGLKIEFKKLAILPPGEIGSFTFFKSP